MRRSGARDSSANGVVAKAPARAAHASLLKATRELLLDLEHHDVNEALQLAPHPPGDANGEPSSTQLRTPIRALSLASASAAVTRDGPLFDELESVRSRLAEEEESAAALRQENERLSVDVRSLAQQLKQERAAGNAVLKQSISTTGGEGTEPVDPHEGNSATNGLTLASAASQILMLRREVKFLQKQWNTARRDMEGAARRDEVQQLQEEAKEANRRAAEAEERARSALARQRMLIRELSRARAKLAAQAARIERRTASQLEAAALRGQLHRVQEQLLHSQQQLKQRLLREELARGEEADRKATDADSSRGELAAAGAQYLVAQLLFAAELGAVEQAAHEVNAELAELKSIKPDATLRQLQQAEEDRVRLTTELAHALERLALLQEEKQLMRQSSDVSSIATVQPNPKNPAEELKLRANSFIAAKFKKNLTNNRN